MVFSVSLTRNQLPKNTSYQQFGRHGWTWSYSLARDEQHSALNAIWNRTFNLTFYSHNVQDCVCVACVCLRQREVNSTGCFFNCPTEAAFISLCTWSLSHTSFYFSVLSVFWMKETKYKYGDHFYFSVLFVFRMKETKYKYGDHFYFSVLSMFWMKETKYKYGDHFYFSVLSVFRMKETKYKYGDHFWPRGDLTPVPPNGDPPSCLTGGPLDPSPAFQGFTFSAVAPMHAFASLIMLKSLL